MKISSLILTCVIAIGRIDAAQPSSAIAAEIDSYLQPYIQTGNFSGVVRVSNARKVVFEKAYGLADREHHVRNTPKTRFHIASLSMQFTAAAVLRLADAGSLSLDEHVGDLVKGTLGAEKITIRDLLTERSGLPDMNQLSDYDNILQQHQTPSTLIGKIAGKPLLFEPGSKYLHEEHSAYNLLALIIERKTGVPFASALERSVVRPLGLTSSGADDDSDVQHVEMARGYQPDGTYGLTPASAIHWSAKAGNASIYTTTRDADRLVASFFAGNSLTADSREAALDPSTRVGYGWFKGKSQRFGKMTYYMNGRAPGFSSFVIYLPESQTTVVVLSNVYSSATTAIGYDVAAISRGLPYEAFHVLGGEPDTAKLASCKGVFQFGPDFYRADAKLTVFTSHSDLFLRWPGGSVSPLIPLAPDRYIDRSYWEEVRVERDASGKPTALIYDHFRGTRCPRCEVP